MASPPLSSFLMRDRSALHTPTLNESYSIGGYYPAESYLDVDKGNLHRKKKIKADAIHPGYGSFLRMPHLLRQSRRAVSLS
jgi:acetyl/propionyl-CoA carboxylase alpha subunit